MQRLLGSPRDWPVRLVGLVVAVRVGRSHFRRAHDLVATLPHSAAHEAVFTFTNTMADLCPTFFVVINRYGRVRSLEMFDTHPSGEGLGA